ncbi:NUDIX domain-containing protein [Ensifer soli]|uniref:NUDIX domain-containing protein n=1 Tax=Ciceribacter sp. sgz301302 TaxID=3342379 RepID=UPI0035B79788
MSDRDDIEILSTEILSKRFYTLRKITLSHTALDGRRLTLVREIVERDNAASILLYDPARGLVVFVRQFRLPAYLNGHDGYLLETPAGLLDGDDPEAGIRREVMEETGYRVRDIRPLFSSFMSPGGFMEKVHFFAATVDAADRVAPGGGLASEDEDIEIVELTLDAALSMIGTGGIADAKTIMLLQWAALNRAMLESGRLA